MNRRIVINQERLLKTIIITLLFVFSMNPNLGEYRWLSWGVTLGGVAALFLYSGNIRILKIDRFLWWYFAFVMVCAMSLLWTIDFAASTEYLKAMVVNGLVLLAVNSVIREPDDITMVIRAIFISIVINSLYLIFKIDWATIGTDRLGVDYTGEGWNANSIGLMSVWGFSFSLFLKKKRNLLGYIWWIPLLILLLFSGSRKAWVSAVLVIVLGQFVQNRNKILKNILISVGVIAVLWQMVINVPFLYELAGHRFESLVEGLLGTGEVDHSTYLRQEYARLGMIWFWDKPLFGHGINAYRRLLVNSVFREYTYSHNNYVELLVNGGVVGFATFYYIFIWGIVRGCTQVFGKYRSEGDLSKKVMLLVGMTVIQLFLHMGMVAYTDKLTLVLVLLLSRLLVMQKEESIEKADG